MPRIGSVPALNESTTDFLRGDGTWAAPAGGSGSGMMVVNLVADNAAATWTNMPLAATLFAGSHRHVVKADLSDFTQVRLVVNKQATAGAANAVLELRYATSFATTPAGYSSIGEQVVQVAVNVANTVLDSGWVNLEAGAKGDVFLAVVGSGGDGVLDPTFGNISAQFQ